MTDSEKLRAVLALIDKWMEEAGPGSKAEKVYGLQMVSVEFVHKEVHALTDLT